MSIPRGTTPTFTLTFTDQDLDLTEARNVYVTFGSHGSALTKSGESLDVTAKSIAVYLTQKETLKFKEGDIEIQANWTTPGGGRAASDIVKYPISRQLLQRVIE